MVRRILSSSSAKHDNPIPALSQPLSPVHQRTNIGKQPLRLYWWATAGIKLGGHLGFPKHGTTLLVKHRSW